MLITGMGMSRRLIVVVRTVVLQPGHVLVVGRGGGVEVLDQGRHGAAIFPLVDFGMAVGKGKAASTAVVTGRPINYPVRGGVGIAIHLDDEVGVIDAVLALVEQDKSVSRPRT